VHGQRVLTEAVSSVRALHPDLPVTTMLSLDLPAEVLVKLSGPESIVVVGCRGGSRLSGALFGSVGQRVAAHAAGTVVVVGDGRYGRSSSRGILVGVSDSPGGRAALEFGYAEAALRGCRITAVRAYGGLGHAHFSVLREHAATVLSDAVSRLQNEHGDISVDCELVDDEEPTRALAALTRDAELLVLGCRHPDDHWPSRLGPITGELLHTSRCPVAIVGIPQLDHLDPTVIGRSAVTSGGTR
jgi:nucleotide-binding universal stress UspA family protein